MAIDGVPRGTVFFVEPERLLIAGVDTNDGPDHPCYQRHAHRPVDDDFVESLLEDGIIEPVVVWKDPQGKLYVVAGRRRVVGARAANQRLANEHSELIRVPCVLRRGEPHRLLGVKITENEQREPTGPLDKARDAQQLINLGRSEREVAKRLRMSPQRLSLLLKLLDLIPDVQQAVADRKIAYTAAVRRCWGKPPEEQLAALGEKPSPRKRPGPTRPQLRKLISMGLPPDVERILRFVVGEISLEDAGIRFAQSELPFAS